MPRIQKSVPEAEQPLGFLVGSSKTRVMQRKLKNTELLKVNDRSIYLFCNNSSQCSGCSLESLNQFELGNLPASRHFVRRVVESLLSRMPGLRVSALQAPK